jgi:hypothetical protein
MMGAQGMGMRRPRRFVQRMFDDAQPQDELYEPQERTGTPPEFSGYIDPDSIAALLTGARKDAISQGLIGAGAALLGADDLSSGLAKGAQAFSSPFFEYKDLARSLPIEMAGKRYELAGEEQGRQRDRNMMGMRGRLFDYDVSERQHKRSMQPIEMESGKLNNALGRVGLQGDRLKLKDLPDQLAYLAQNRTLSLEQLREEINQLKDFFPYRKRGAEADRYATMSSGYRNYIDAGDSGGGRGGAGIWDDATLSRIQGTMDKAVTDADEQVNSGRLSGASPSIQEGFRYQRIYDALANVPPALADKLFPQGRIVDRVLADSHNPNISDEQLAQKYRNNPTAYALVSYLLWDREAEVPARGR